MALLSVAHGGAPGPAQSAAGPPPGPAPRGPAAGTFQPADSVTVWVRSQYRVPVHVYAREAGRLRSIGVVVTNDTIRDRMGLVSGENRIRLIADPVGARDRYETGPIDFGPGDRIEWIIGSHLPMSAVFVRAVRDTTGGDDRRR